MSIADSLERPQASNAPDIAIDCRADKIFYGKFLAVRDSNIPIEKGKITGFIGPSGCGKSTVLRSLNRMNDLIKDFRLEGQVNFHGQDIYARGIDPVVVRRHIGMVFQQPNPSQSSTKLQHWPEPKRHADQGNESSAQHLAIALKRTKMNTLNTSGRIDAQQNISHDRAGREHNSHGADDANSVFPCREEGRDTFDHRR